MAKLVKSTENLFDFFHENVRSAQDEVTVELDPDTVLYLANLLTDRARVQRDPLPETTLAELHGRAALAPPSHKARVYRELGDRALYQLGFFTESVESSVVSCDYYSDMGAAAYYQVDQTFKTWFADAFGPVFKELANRFRECTNILAHVRHNSDSDHPDTIVRIYQKWLETGDTELCETLRKLGILVKDQHNIIH